MFPSVVQTPEPGFCFENTIRNAKLDDLIKGKKQKPLKTGTTIAGVVFKDGVVLGADTRATSSEVIADKMCAKIHYLAPNIYCCGAGTAADTQKITDLIRSNLTIFSMNSGRNPRAIMAVSILQDTLFRYHGQIGANLLLGGVDCTGGHLYDIGPYGDMDKVPFLAMGSGNLAAMGILEDGFKADMDMESAKHLVRDAIHAGVMNDLASGHNIDLCVITRKGVDYIRPYQESERVGKREGRYKYKPGTTAVVTEQTQHFELNLIQESVQTMETS